MKKIIPIVALAFFTMLNAHAQQSPVYIANGHAIKGYDPVAFFTLSRPVKGEDSLAWSWKGASWLFSSRANLESFRANPEKYAPQYGGYCAYGTSQGHKAPTETDTWTVLDDKLYFNYNSKVKEIWKKDRAGYIKTADQKWPDLKDN
jgi:YHS domain-containing protein